jgi:hypothetical protein
MPPSSDILSSDEPAAVAAPQLLVLVIKVFIQPGEIEFTRFYRLNAKRSSNCSNHHGIVSFGFLPFGSLLTSFVHLFLYFCRI